MRPLDEDGRECGDDCHVAGGPGGGEAEGRAAAVIIRARRDGEVDVEDGGD